jgi:serine protease Do
MTSDGGYLGVQTTDVNKDNFSKYGLREVRGVAVEKVIENSPAATAGLRDGDVIIRFDGEEVGSVRKLTRLISETAADHRVRITVLRNGSEQELTATLGKREPMRMSSRAFTLPRIPDMPMSPDVPNIMTLPRGEGRAFAWTRFQRENQGDHNLQSE